jgi:hypothetical protein
MKVKELIEHLKKFDGDLQVYAYCDHGQTPEAVNAPEEILVADTVNRLWDDWSFVGDEYAEEYGYTTKAVLL